MLSEIHVYCYTHTSSPHQNLLYNLSVVELYVRSSIFSVCTDVCVHCCVVSVCSCLFSDADTSPKGHPRTYDHITVLIPGKLIACHCTIDAKKAIESKLHTLGKKALDSYLALVLLHWTLCFDICISWRYFQSTINIWLSAVVF